MEGIGMPVKGEAREEGEEGREGKGRKVRTPPSIAADAPALTSSVC